jgi:hypothetical protein
MVQQTRPQWQQKRRGASWALRGKYAMGIQRDLKQYGSDLYDPYTLSTESNQHHHNRALSVHKW